MKHISLKVSEKIKHILPDTLEKDLQDNEIICPTCHGLGIVKRHQPFGLKEKETDEGYFPKINWYDNEYLTSCPNCYTGVVRLCKYCGKPITKGYIDKCDCETYQEIQVEKAYLKYQETINKAKEVQPDDVKTMFYDEISDKYYSEIEDFIDCWEDDIENLPQVLWVCSETKISVDAQDIIENACSDLNEDASDNCDYNSLQEFLNKWCEEQTGTTSYYPCYDEYVKVKKEWFKERKIIK